MYDNDGYARAEGRGGQPPADPHSADVVAAVDALASDDPAVLGFAGQLWRLRAVNRLVDRLEAERVRLLGVADRSGALSEDGAATAASWLRYNSTLTATQAKQRAKLARQLPDLPVIAAAFAAGDLGVSHVSQVLGLCRDVGFDKVAGVQDELVEVARRLRMVEDFTRVCMGWRHALRPDAADEDDDRAHDARRLTHTATFDGTFHLNGKFDAVGGGTLAAAINAYMTADPPDTPPDEQRDIEQRRRTRWSRWPRPRWPGKRRARWRAPNRTWWCGSTSRISSRILGIPIIASCLDGDRGVCRRPRSIGSAPSGPRCWDGCWMTAPSRASCSVLMGSFLISGPPRGCGRWGCAARSSNAIAAAGSLGVTGGRSGATSTTTCPGKKAGQQPCGTDCCCAGIIIARNGATAGGPPCTQTAPLPGGTPTDAPE